MPGSENHMEVDGGGRPESRKELRAGSQLAMLCAQAAGSYRASVTDCSGARPTWAATPEERSVSLVFALV